MGLSAGIIGLPNVGKSTLFNAITKSNILAENYPFATIDPNVGIVPLNDERLDCLEKIYNTKKKIYATFEFTDIAGLVKGASKGEGLGNKFLSHIRQVDALCHVVRCFNNTNIVHVEGRIDSVSDAEIINLELLFSDLEVIEKRIQRVEKKAKSGDSLAKKEFELLVFIKEKLENNEVINKNDFNEEQLKILSSFELLSLKPMIYIANLADDDLLDLDSNIEYQKLLQKANEENRIVIPLSADLEVTLSSLSNKEKNEFLSDLGLPKSGLDNLVEKTYKLLGLRTFFTAGEKETRAWTFKDGMKAPECAGIIHSDFERGFIRAETISYNDLLETGNYQKSKELGKVRQEGKNYVVQDGDIMLFKFNV